MKRNIGRLAVLITAAVLTLVVMSRLIGVDAATSAYPAATASGEAVYVVREHNGKVALFTDEFTSTPAVETDIDVAGLRAYDRELLTSGIEVATYEDVLRLLEDFGS